MQFRVSEVNAAEISVGFGTVQFLHGKYVENKPAKM